MDTGESAARMPGPSGRTIIQVIPWAKTFLDYTDAVMNDLPQDDTALDYRPVDPNGAYVMSIREQAMHIADTRHSAIGWLTGDSEDDDIFLAEYGGTDKPWEWKAATREEILAVNKSGREKIDALLAKPAEAMFEVTDNIRKQFDEANAKMTEAGQDISERLARGPAPLINTLLFIVSHELGHRAVLQFMLRVNGHKVTRYA